MAITELIGVSEVVAESAAVSSAVGESLEEVGTVVSELTEATESIENTEVLQTLSETEAEYLSELNVSQELWDSMSIEEQQAQMDVVNLRIKELGINPSKTNFGDTLLPEIQERISVEGLSISEKIEIIERTGWSDDIVDAVRTKEEAEIYIKADLKEIEINGKKALIRGDIDFEQKDVFGQTNRERMNKGLAPLNKDGETIYLHHIGQKPESPLAELTHEEHMEGGNDSILHDKSISSKVHTPENESEWTVERKNHWKSRANQNN